LADPVLRGWREIEKVTPWAHKPDFFRRKYGQWMRDNGSVLSDYVDGKFCCFAWESVVKAGITRLLAERRKNKKV
jgi:regulation of enolase protein 1 (concanavalin A-like superfamily)